MTPLGGCKSLFTALLVAVIEPLGGDIAGIVEGKFRIPRPLGALETGIYRLAGIDPARERS